MKPRSVMLLVAMGVAGLAPAPARTEPSALDRLAWLAGCWQVETGELGTGEIWLGTKLVQDQRELNRLSQELADADAANDEVRYDELVNQYNARLEQRTARQWLFGALLAYAMIDAYVDAHFRGFEIEFQTDPALPAGPEPASGGQGGVGARLALRWDF